MSTELTGSYLPALSDYQEPHRTCVDVVQHDRFGGFLHGDFLTASPYTDAQHLLDIRTLDSQDQIFALAMTTLTTSGPDYATSIYEAAFDWRALMRYVKSLADTSDVAWTRREFYVVEFRSKLKENIDVELLYSLDKESHAEATQSGGLLKYWYGCPDEQRRNLATCLWRNKEDAIKRRARAVASPGESSDSQDV